MRTNLRRFSFRVNWRRGLEPYALFLDVTVEKADQRCSTSLLPQLRAGDLALTLDGILALNSGDVLKAKSCLMESVRVCYEDDFALITCGARTLNVMLAERLIDHGEQDVVIKYLIECQRVGLHCEADCALD